MAHFQTEYDVRFKTPFTCILAGPSRSGKTTWLVNCLKYSDVMFTTKPAYTVFYYSAWQDLYDEMVKLNLVSEWRNECPTLEYITELAAKYKHDGGLTIIVDDLISQINKDVVNLFQVGSHHRNINLFFISQNLFYDDKKYRDMKINANYIVLFKNPANVKQADTFFGQIAGEENKTALKNVFKKITKKAHSYVLFDLNQDTPDEIRIRTKIFPHEYGVHVYVPPNLTI